MTRKSSRLSTIAWDKVAPKIAFTVNCLLFSSIGILPAAAANHESVKVEPSLSTAIELPVQLAQTESTILNFRTSGYSVRVFEIGDRTVMNVYDRVNDIVRLREGPASYTVLGNNPTYISTGSYSGNAATYQVTAIGEGQLELLIRTGAGAEIANQRAEVITLFDIPREEFEAQGETVLNFETDAYSVRVFMRGEQSFMNVYNTFSGLTEVNGTAANVAPNDPPYERAVSYVSSGARSDRPVQYFARILSTGEALLEVYNVNNQRIFQEYATGPVTYNFTDLPPGILPEDLAPSATAQGAFVAAVFGDEDVIDEVKQIYPNATMEDTRLGPFVNAGDFNNENSAAARVLELRGLGFNARVIYRGLEYR
ncbi:MAG: hypothetical protein ACFBSF_08330 [Leptolyngbyaceae cyanobacterium]